MRAMRIRLVFDMVTKNELKKIRKKYREKLTKKNRYNIG